MISVIIPTYNRAALLAKAIDSVASQTVPCDELVIVDDGSTDETAELLERTISTIGLSLRYVKQKNCGAAAARNRGIRESRGNMLCFLDSDDCFSKKKIAVQYEAMKNNPDYLISHTREIWYRRGKIVNQKKKHQPPHGDIFERCLPMCVVGMSTVMIRRELFDLYGVFDEQLPCCEDYDLWLRVSRKEKFLLVDEPLTIKDGGRDDQLSAQYRLGMDKYRIRSLGNFLVDREALTAHQIRLVVRELERKCRIYGNGCLKHGKESEGRSYLDLAGNYKKMQIKSEQESTRVLS